ncbi:hypothetical protein LCGC14_2971740, partial [marine sediment metagenome]
MNFDLMCSQTWNASGGMEMTENVVFTLNDWLICRLPDNHNIRDLRLLWLSSRV